jgi:hypothetical protein
LGDRTLYHYTTPAGLHGILDTKSVYASSVHHLDDDQEFLYPLKLIAAELEHRATGVDEAAALARYLGGRLARFGDGGNLYAASFCEEPDDPRMWSEYCRKGGYCIGFAVSRNA